MKTIVCSNCVMDTTDSMISFDVNGVCDHCNTYKKYILPKWNPEGIDDSKLFTLAQKIKKEGVGQDFDCIMGMSGGIDSSYLLYLLTIVDLLNFFSSPFLIRTISF